jgi:hypothetical protein
VQIHVVDEQVHRNGVVGGYSHEGAGSHHFDLLALDRDVQILGDLENVVADLILGVAVDHGEAGLLGHFVAELVLGHVSGDDFVGRVGAISQEDGPHNGLQRSFAALMGKTAQECKVMATSTGTAEQRFSPGVCCSGFLRSAGGNIRDYTIF